MKQKELRKKIKILSYGTIHALGGITGPVNTPFFLPVKKILGLLNSNVKINEVLPDGTEIELTFDNFDTVNYKVPEKEEPVSEPIHEDKKEDIIEDENVTIIDKDDSNVEETVIEAEKEETVEDNETIEDNNDVEEEYKEEESVQQENHYYKKNNYKNNKNNNRKNNYNKPKNN